MSPQNLPSSLDKTKIGLGLALGPLLFLATALLDSPSPNLSADAWLCAGVAAWMAIWWMTEAVPLPVTSFLPLILCPVTGILDTKSVASSYSHPLIFLFMGGFILSIAIERCGLHLRIARSVISAVGSNARMQIGSVMFVTAFLSMWISNTATAVMMLPIAMSIATLLNGNASQNAAGRFTTTLLLGVAYSASIGGLATIIGTPPNALLVAYLENNYGIQIGFGQWMLFGIPFSGLFLLITWAFLTRGQSASARSSEATQQIRSDLRAMGPMSSAEKAVFVVFLFTAAAWIFRIQIASATGLEITDTGIAMTAALVLFLIPDHNNAESKRLLDWGAMKRLPWGVLILFGGGLALASSIKSSGLADTIGTLFASLDGMDVVWIAAIVATVVVFLTEITSNTATAAGLLPLMGPVALSLGATPGELAIPAAIAASCAFMLPVATPPNAIVFSSGDLRISDMIRAGFVLNVVAILMLVISAKWLIPFVF